MFDLLREIGQTLRSNKLRTALTGLAVSWGIFMLIALLGAARGVVNDFEYNQSNSEENNSIEIYNGSTTMPYRGYKTGRTISPGARDMPALDKVKGVTKTTANDWKGDIVISNEHGSVSAGVNAAYNIPEHLLSKLDGRDFNSRDIEELRRVIVIGDRDAAQLFEDPSKAVGSTVRCMGLAWKVVGVYTHEWLRGVYVPYTTFKAVTGNDDRAYRITATFEGVTNEAEAEEAEQRLRETLAERHQFDPADRNAMWMWSGFKNYFSTLKSFIYLRLGVWVIGLFTLLSGIVGVSNIMFVSVRERTHEIGVRRAIGAKPRSILTQVLAESVALTSIFGYIGIVMGMVALQVLHHFLGDQNGFRNPTVDISIALSVMVALIIAGALAGLFPALKAIKVKPVEALRDE